MSSFKTTTEQGIAQEGDTSREDSIRKELNYLGNKLEEADAQAKKIEDRSVELEAVESKIKEANDALHIAYDKEEESIKNFGKFNSQAINAEAEIKGFEEKKKILENIVIEITKVEQELEAKKIQKNKVDESINESIKERDYKKEIQVSELEQHNKKINILKSEQKKIEDNCADIKSILDGIEKDTLLLKVAKNSLNNEVIVAKADLVNVIKDKEVIINHIALETKASQKCFEDKNKQLDDKEKNIIMREGEVSEREGWLSDKEETLRNTKLELEKHFNRKIPHIII